MNSGYNRHSDPHYPGRDKYLNPEYPEDRLEWHPKVPGATGHDSRDHWHLKGRGRSKKPIYPGDEIGHEPRLLDIA